MDTKQSPTNLGLSFGGINCLVVFPTHFNLNNNFLKLVQISLLFGCTRALKMYTQLKTYYSVNTISNSSPKGQFWPKRLKNILFRVAHTYVARMREHPFPPLGIKLITKTCLRLLRVLKPRLNSFVIFFVRLKLACGYYDRYLGWK